MGRPAKALSVLKRTVGSNPTLSANIHSENNGVSPVPLHLSLVTDRTKGSCGRNLQELDMTKHSPLVRVVASIGLAVGVLAGPAVGAPSAHASCTSFIVERGDSWSLLADYAGVGLAAMLKANNATSRTVILPGQSLCVPKGAVFSRPGTSVEAEAVTPKLVLPKVRLSAAESTAIIREVFPDKLERRALKIAQRESRLNHVAHSWCCLGLFQIYFGANKTFLGTLGITNASQLLDARTNATAAYAMYQRSGWAPWDLAQ